MQSFIWGGSTGVSSPQELQRRRALADAIRARNAGNVPKNLWEGLNSFADSIGSAIAMKRLDKAEADNQAKAASGFDRVVRLMADNNIPVSAASSAPSLEGASVSQPNLGNQATPAAYGKGLGLGVGVGNNDGRPPFNLPAQAFLAPTSRS